MPEPTPHATFPGCPGIPHRIDLAGGWLDQPHVSALHPGPVVGCSIDPRDVYTPRSGMAGSTRDAARRLWGAHLPAGDPEHLARKLFDFENPPGTVEVAGSQDAIGIVYPGATCMHYEGGYWPTRIDHTADPATLRFLQDRLYLRPVGPRSDDFRVLARQNPNARDAERLADAAHALWAALKARDAPALGRAMTRSLAAQTAMYPLMRSAAIDREIAAHGDAALGHKVSGAGGGGYVVFFSETPIPGALRPRLRGGEAEADADA